METDVSLRNLLQKLARVEPEPLQVRVGVGDTLGRYRLVRELGRGGFGVVFAAFDPELGREVALKVMRQRQDSDGSLREQFHREASIVARLKHPHIVTLYDWSKSGDTPYLVLELLDGETLEQRLRRGPLLFDEALDLSLAVAGALAHAHASGAVHRDLKPSNVFLCGGGIAKVLDFGLAHDGRGAHLLEGAGTPSYMAPEQRDGAQSDARSDVWAFGVVLREMLAGRVPRALRPLVARTLAERPEERFADGSALLVELTRVQRERRDAAHARWRRRAVATVAGTAALLLVGAAAVMQGLSASRVRAAAEAAAEVSRIESVLRFAHMAPRHDVAADETLARGELQALEARLARKGRFARSRGELALGRGLLALGDFAAAARALRAARADGDEGDEARQALGEALGGEWERRMRELDWLRDDRQRQELEEQLQVELLRPATQLLAGGHAQSALALARLALWQGDEQEALRLARTAGEAAIWLYEADLVAASVHERQARLRLRQGRFDEAQAALDAAEAASARALDMGRSDPEVHGAACARAALRVEVGNLSGHPNAGVNEAARAACDRALAVAPHHIDPYVSAVEIRLEQVEETHGDRARVGALYEEVRQFVARAQTALHGSDDALALSIHAAAHRALRLQNLGEDPTPILDAALPVAEALRARRGGELVNTSLADLRFAQIRAQIDHGVDPVASCARLEALIGHTHFPTQLSRLGRILLMRGEWEASHEGDPTAAWQRAIEAYQAALLQLPGNAQLLDELSGVYYDRALQAQGLGLDGSDEYRRSVEVAERGLALRPSSPVALANLGVTFGDWAQGELRLGRDPTPILERALDVLGRSSRIEPRAPDTWFALSIAHRLAAQWLVERHRDPGAALAAGRVAADKAVALSPGNVAMTELHGNLLQVEASWLEQLGRSPLAPLTQAEVIFRRLTTVDPTRESFTLGLADVTLRLAEWRVAHGGSADLTAARNLLQPLLGRPRPPSDVWKEQARLLTIAARQAPDDAERRRLKDEAQASLAHIPSPGERARAQQAVLAGTL